MVLKFDITGMTCAACSARVEKVTASVPGVSNVNVNLLQGTMTVDATDVSVVDVIKAKVSDAGYQAVVHGEKRDQKPQDTMQRDMKKRIIVSAILLTVLMYFTMGHMLRIPMPAWYHEHAMIAVLTQFLLTLPIVFLNRSYYLRGFKALWKRNPNMDSLIAVGSGAAMLYSVVTMFRMAYAAEVGDTESLIRYRGDLYFESAATILTLITVGKFLEARAKGKTGDAIRQLMDLSPKQATVLVDGTEKVIPVDAVKIGDVVVVRSGGSIPVDGTVISGRAAVDQSALTGESVPVEKSEGDTVCAATINREGYLQIRADKIGEDTTLSQVIRLVEDAGATKAPIARLADKIAGIFVPVVMAIAVVAFCVWMIAGEGFEFAMTAGIAVMVISCPCALGLATPVAIMVGTGRGARMGILFKNAEALENLHKVNTVVLDKTGTLTTGHPSVTDIFPVSTDATELLRIAAALESRSEHPFAKAIMERNGDLQYPDVHEFATLPGQGVSGVIEGKKYFGGNRRLMEQLGIQVQEHSELEQQGKTPLYFACEDGRLLGIIAAADTLKGDSAAAVAAMHRLRLKVIMLTGDNQKTAEAIADIAGIDQVISDVLPGDKAKIIQDLRAEGANVLMVGDGINDAPALVCADVGMAIGSGTDIAVESAGVVLMRNSLAGVCDAIALSKATMRNIRQNLFWAFFYNALGIPVAAGALYPAFKVLLSPMIGAAAMSLSSFFVVTNALRLRFFKPSVPVEVTTTEVVKEEIKMETVIKVNGMMCPHCQARVESVCKEIPGVVDAVVDLQEKQVTVTGDANMEALKKAITDAGYEVIE